MKRITGVIFAAALMLKGTFLYAAAENAEEMQLCTENENLSLYVNYDSGEVILKDKKNGSVWRSTPENADSDMMATNAVISELKSPLSITYCEPEKRSSTKLSSLYGADVMVKDITDGVKVTYKFKKAGITVPLCLVLGENYLEATVDVSGIKESKESRKLTKLSIMNSFGAAGSDDKGYFVIPDGSGALINFNNGKTNAKSYTGMVYGRDITKVPVTMPDNIKQVYFPMYGIVSGDSGLMAVCTDGDSNAQLTASVSGVSRSSYNLCSFDFTLRSDDTYYMAGDSSTAFTVFEDGDIKTDKISIRYYPLEDTGRKGMDYVDVAAAYREYLMNEMNVDKAYHEPELYISLYGAVEKKRSFLGIPITMKTALTTSEQAKRIMETLKNSGVDNLVVSYNKWTNDGIKNKVDTKAEAAGIIGGNDFYDLIEYAEKNGFILYPSVKNTGFKSGSGYSEHKDGTVRVSGEYARLYDYDIVSGNALKSKGTLALLSPSEYPDMFKELSDNFSKNGIKNISLSELACTLYGDYGNSSISRDKSQRLLEDGYKILENSMDSILADRANAYVLPYVERISNVPLSSGEYDIFDEDIPFYQIVMHGLRSYSTEPINGSADSRELLLLAIASGSNPNYDMIGEKTSVLTGTELENLYYANHDDWTDQAAQDLFFVRTVLKDVGGQFITDYRQEDSKVYTEYENGSVIITDFENMSVTSGGKEYFLSDFSVSGG